ncbi:hypothetical protein TNCV_2464061 [Trichonephila clavipes]|nr:hypothetical protein TNCV_2464061 [Trichonephila clavipes]
MATLGHQSLPPTNMGRVDEKITSSGKGLSQHLLLEFYSKKERPATGYVSTDQISGRSQNYELDLIYFPVKGCGAAQNRNHNNDVQIII